MDTTDPDIYFDEIGNCNHCNNFLANLPHVVNSGSDGMFNLERQIEKARVLGKSKKYDAIIGLSGGMDSSYVAYITKEFKLRILAVHLDNGWNSELSVNNIENCIKYLKADLYTHVIDWDEFKNMQLAYLRAGVVDIEVLSDHAIRSIIYKLTAKYGIEYNLSGYNYVTEGILPRAWVFNKLDYKNIKTINKLFGVNKIRTYPGMSLPRYIYYRTVAKIKTIDILNYIEYDVDKARKQMEDKMSWQYYGGKHHESIFTKFYQGYILPKKFGIDKRKAHFSSLICSGNMTRESAMTLLENNFYSESELHSDMEYVIKKLGISKSEFDTIMELEPISHLSYSNNKIIFDFLKQFS